MFIIFFYFVFLIWFFSFYIFMFNNYMRLISLWFLCFSFLVITFSFLFYNQSILWFQLLFNFYMINFWNIAYNFGLDGLSLSLIMICNLLIIFCILMYWFLKYKINIYLFLLIFALWILMNIFISFDIMVFYIFFEAIVMPMFLLIGIWGSRVRRISASYQFFLYTLFGSFFVLLSFLFIYFAKGSTSFEFFQMNFLNNERSFWIWMFLFIGFAVKMPMMPFHIWLPEAHVEAPTPGSVILAGILLKLGTYAFFRFLMYNFNFIYDDIIFLIIIMGLSSFLYASLIAFNQIDMKKIMAYSSMAHMNFSLISFFLHSFIGLIGVFIMMLSHALTSSALFFCIGVLYDRYKTRINLYYSGLVFFMPLFSVIFFFLSLSNFGFPGTFNFVGEFCILYGMMTFSPIILVFVNIGLVLTLMYSLFLYNRIFYGYINDLVFMRYYCDMISNEFFILMSLMFLIILFGLFPNMMINFFSMNLIKFVCFI